MKIRPSWVLAGVALIVMFIAARFVVGTAIDGAIKIPKDQRAPLANQDGVPDAKPAKEPPGRNAPEVVPNDPFGNIFRTLTSLETLRPDQLEGALDVIRASVVELDEATAAGVNPENRERVLAQFQRGQTFELAAPVKADLARAHKKLSGWWDIEVSDTPQRF